MARGDHSPRFRFFSGKGGVGKTTTATAFAIARAEEGRSGLLISTDPAHSLANALDAKVGPKPRRVKVKKGRLDALELDADAALERWLDERRATLGTIAERGTYLDKEDVEKFLRLSLPGVDELVGLLELVRVGREHEVDLVVVDTAPTGHTLRLLEMPAT
ncbi:MAG: ArsA family ATPase, partial [Planctomycetota bacterium]